MTYSVNENRSLFSLVVARFCPVEKCFGGLLIIRVCLYSGLSTRGKTNDGGLTVCITTSDAAANSVSLSRSDKDVTTVLTPRVFNNLAFSALRTSAVISNVSLLG